MNSLSGKVALVTGASRGLGRSIALALGKAGVDVAVTDLLVETDEIMSSGGNRYGQLNRHFIDKGQVKTKETADEIQQMGADSLSLQMDVSKPTQIREVVGKIEEALGPIDILVNNAGLMGNFAFIEKQTAESWETTIKVNLSGAFYCTKAVWQGMRQKKWGRIINISSITGKMGAFAQTAYGASKAGIMGLTRSLALEGAHHGITVNAILPGLIDTEAIRILGGNNIEEQSKKRIPMQRLGKPEEIAHTVLFLAAEMSGYITGASIPVTGGIDLMVI